MESRRLRKVEWLSHLIVFLTFVVFQTSTGQDSVVLDNPPFSIYDFEPDSLSESNTVFSRLVKIKKAKRPRTLDIPAGPTANVLDWAQFQAEFQSRPFDEDLSLPLRARSRFGLPLGLNVGLGVPVGWLLASENLLLVADLKWRVFESGGTALAVQAWAGKEFNPSEYDANHQPKGADVVLSHALSGGNEWHLGLSVSKNNAWSWDQDVARVYWGYEWRIGSGHGMTFSIAPQLSEGRGEYYDNREKAVVLGVGYLLEKKHWGLSVGLEGGPTWVNSTYLGPDGNSDPFHYGEILGSLKLNGSIFLRI